MKKLLSLLLVLAMLAAIFVACDDEPTAPAEPPADNTSTHTAPAWKDLEEVLKTSEVKNFDAVSLSDTATDYVLLDVANYGKILVRLFPDVAPETVQNFKALVSEGFYDGLIFHRVIENFMIQGGDPKGDGTGGSPKNIKGEFKNNGFENNLKHLRGVVSMARRGDDMNSASSQFFICHQNFASGNGDYAAFGYVVYGMETVDKIARVKTNSGDKPQTDVVITSTKFANVPAEALIAPPDPLDLLPVSTEATDYVLLDVENYGKILIHLYPDEAPETVANFKALVADGFYDGLTFHRVIRGFMIQGGDPMGNGTGGSDTTITGEFESNGIENRIPHIRGVLSMARNVKNPDDEESKNSASSQFFICQGAESNLSHLNGDYAAFGYVLEGMDVVDKIANVSVNNNNKPRTTVRITSIKFVTVAADAYDDPIAEQLTPAEPPVGQ